MTNVRRCTTCSKHYRYHNGHSCGTTIITKDEAEVLHRIRKPVLWWLAGLR
jgi:hypothetical protein